ncbi:MAG: Alcohol dehydrogenase zinc-binding domain protein [Rhodospirillales bacterium]|nr:Alcohol dehydrogenase zinc-binding domain protein [Rhodospirillales bacterium]
MPMMEAVRIESFGGPDVLRLQQVLVPSPGAAEILLKVHAASVNPVDYKIRSGKYPAVKSDMLPYTLGRDASGLAVACGPGVTIAEKGDALYAVPAIDRGCYAQYVIVKQKEAARKPSSLDHVMAAAVPLAGLTAWQGLFRHGGLEAGQRVLIHGGAGGVGHFAIQLAKAKGAYVVTTVSKDNIDFARQLGADEVIDYKNERFEHKVSGMDMVFDLVAGETQDRSWGVLKKGGILVSTLTPPPPEKAAKYGVRGMRYTVKESGAELAEIAALIDAGKVVPHVARTYPLNEAAAAHEFLEKGSITGKIVLVVEG